MWLSVHVITSNILKTAKILGEFTTKEIISMERKKYACPRIKMILGSQLSGGLGSPLRKLLNLQWEHTITVSFPIQMWWKWVIKKKRNKQPEWFDKNYQENLGSRILLKPELQSKQNIFSTLSTQDPSWHLSSVISEFLQASDFAISRLSPFLMMMVIYPCSIIAYWGWQLSSWQVDGNLSSI